MYSKMKFFCYYLALIALFGCITSGKQSDNCMEVIKTFYNSADSKATMMPPSILQIGMIHFYAVGDNLHALCLLITPASYCAVPGDIKSQCKMDSDLILYYGTGVITPEMIEKQKQQQQQKRLKEIPPI